MDGGWFSVWEGDVIKTQVVAVSMMRWVGSLLAKVSIHAVLVGRLAWAPQPCRKPERRTKTGSEMVVWVSHGHRGSCLCALHVGIDANTASMHLQQQFILPDQQPCCPLGIPATNNGKFSLNNYFFCLFYKATDGVELGSENPDLCDSSSLGQEKGDMTIQGKRNPG